MEEPNAFSSPVTRKERRNGLGALDSFTLRGKKAVVTGGFTGLGKQVAEAMLEAGADVAVCARRPEKWVDSYGELQGTAEKLGRRLKGSKCDVSSQSEVEQFFHEVAGHFGTVDILVNAAGIAWAAPPEEMKLDDWEKVIRINLTGTFLCSQTAGRLMIARKQGSIINMGSVVGLFGVDSQVLDAVAYSASKGGIIGLTRDLALKWATFNIRVNALVPGWFRTHMTEVVIRKGGERLLQGIPMRRLGSETDLKGAAIFLASDASSYVTGQLICVDGGVSAGH
jgi:NAD(P)-dependent dehydrogenase (short-subunit alcohol dehydrogenase family)